MEDKIGSQCIQHRQAFAQGASALLSNPKLILPQYIALDGPDGHVRDEWLQLRTVWDIAGRQWISPPWA